MVIPSSVSYNDKTYAVTCIGASAFFRCEDLTSVTLPNTVSVISKWAFAGCTGLTSITIPELVTFIGDYAFWGCSGLTSVTIPESVTEIGANAFLNCNALLSITIPESIIIGRSAFNGTAWYNSQPDGVVYINRVLYGYKGTMPENTHIDIREGTLSMVDYAFANYAELTSVTMPSSIKIIGSDVFVDCINLSGVTIPLSVTSIGERAFQWCSKLESVTIPPQATTIGDFAFSYSEGLKTVVFGESEVSLGDGVFYRSSNIEEFIVSENNRIYSLCDGILCNKDQSMLIVCPGGRTSVTIPETVKTIDIFTFADCLDLVSVFWDIPVYTDAMPFYNCANIESFSFEDHVEQIPERCCADKSNLTSVEIGKNVKRIGAAAFTGCESLATITSHATVPPVIESTTFEDYNATLYVPAGCGKSYREAEYWKNFMNILESSGSDVKEMADCEMHVYVVDRTLYVENAGPSYRVYTAAGQLVYAGSDTAVPLDAGVYLVCTMSQTQKVMVK